MSSVKELKENETVLCTVTRIENAAVFVNMDDFESEGTITFSEISPGRIRNIREFVNVGKKIVCKVLRKKEDHIELSLRRVSAKERDAILDKYKKERILSSILKPVLGDKTGEVIEKIKQESDTSEICDKLREAPEIIKKFVTSSQLEHLKKQLADKKEKEKEVNKKIIVKSDSDSGIKEIKEVLSATGSNADISYLGSSQFLVRIKGKEYKTANSQLDKVLATMKEKAKSHKVHFEIKWNLDFLQIKMEIKFTH